MHGSRVVLKTGQVISGRIWSVNVDDGWFTVFPDDEDDDVKVRMEACESVVTFGERISRNSIGDQDMLAEWAKRVEEKKLRKGRQ
jgi:hypothetical protein